MSVVEGVSLEGGVLTMGGVALDRALPALRRLEPAARRAGCTTSTGSKHARAGSAPPSRPSA
jgi:hypothetical protein